LFNDAAEEVKEREAKLSRRIRELNAAIEAVQGYVDGVIKQLQILDEYTELAHTDYREQYTKALNEKYEVARHHYRLVYKKVHALNNFKAHANTMLNDLQLQLQRYSFLKLPQMVDTIRQQISQFTEEVGRAEKEIAHYKSLLTAIDAIFSDINQGLESLGHTPVPHPKHGAYNKCWLLGSKV